MARKYLLTHLKDTNRWRKKFNGKAYYFPTRKGEPKEESYKRCWKEWNELKQSLLGESEHIHAWQQLMNNCITALQHAEQTQNPLMYGGAMLAMQQAKAMIELNAPLPTSKLIRRNDGVLTYEGPLQDFLHDNEPWKTNEINTTGEFAPTAKTVSFYAKQFIAEKRKRAERENRSVGTVASIERMIDEFCDIVGKNLPVENVNEDIVTKVFEHLEERVSKGTLKESTAKLRYAQVKSFIKWLNEQAYIDRQPKNLNSRNFRAAPKDIEVLTVQEFQTILSHADGLLRICVLLMANIGAYQSDIADLKSSEVDWKEGRIIRRRTKTAKQENCPIVDYKLWPETFRLLKEFRSKDPMHVILNSNGKPIWGEEFKADGKVKYTDVIYTRYMYVMRKAGIKNPKPLKLLRATGASLIHGKFNDLALADLFLAHAPSGLGAKHYIRPNQEQLDKAITWLGKEYGIVEK